MQKVETFTRVAQFNKLRISVKLVTELYMKMQLVIEQKQALIPSYYPRVCTG